MAYFVIVVVGKSKYFDRKVNFLTKICMLQTLYYGLGVVPHTLRTAGVRYEKFQDVVIRIV